MRPVLLGGLAHGAGQSMKRGAQLGVLDRTRGAFQVACYLGGGALRMKRRLFRHGVRHGAPCHPDRGAVLQHLAGGGQEQWRLETQGSDEGLGVRSKHQRFPLDIQ